MKDLKPIKGAFYIAKLIEEGEHEHQDFKYAISDARKIARSISAFANNSGGHLLIGIRDNGTVAGVKNEEDIYVVEQAAHMMCVPPQPIKVDAFKAEGGLLVFRVEIAEAAEKPVMVKEENDELKAYYRVKDENIAASNLMVRAWKARGSQPITFNEAEKALLGLLEQEGEIEPANYIVRSHVSQALGENTIVNLCAMGVTKIIPCGGREIVVLNS